MLIRTYITLAYAIKQLKRARRRIKRRSGVTGLRRLITK